jgi:hypothetical protein
VAAPVSPRGRRYSDPMGDQRGAAVLERRSSGTPIRVDTRVPRDVARDRRRAVTLLLLTVVLPGSAQLNAGNRTLGRFALRVWVGLLGFAALLGLLFLLSREAALTVVAHRWTLAAVEVVLFGLAALWLVLLVDAWRLGRPARLAVRDRRAVLATLIVAIVVLSGGTAYAAVTVGEARTAMASLFTTGETAAPAARGCGRTRSSSRASMPTRDASSCSGSRARPSTSRSAPARPWPG